jgi:hypothetical protein
MGRTPLTRIATLAGPLRTSAEGKEVHQQLTRGKT